MTIAIIGTGNVGSALATRWAAQDHQVLLGVQDLNNFKGRDLLQLNNIQALPMREAVLQSEVVLIATPPTAIVDILLTVGDVPGKTWIDATNAVTKGPDPYKTVYHCLVDKVSGDVVKCFNTTGFENMLNPVYGGVPIDMFMAGDSEPAKAIARQLALDCGFGSCIDFGKGDKVELLEKFALSWINLAIMQDMGRNLAFRLVRR